MIDEYFDTTKEHGVVAPPVGNTYRKEPNDDHDTSAQGHWVSTGTMSPGSVRPQHWWVGNE
jgi:hypothetical protein